MRQGCLDVGYRRGRGMSSVGSRGVDLIVVASFMMMVVVRVR